MERDTWLSWYAGRKPEVGVVRFAEVLKEARAESVLDVGCGTGRHTTYMAKQGFSVSAFDWSTASIQKAREALEREGLTANLTVWDMNEKPLPYPSGFFDAVLAVRVFHHGYRDQVAGAAAEMTRVTKRRGLLYAEVPTTGRLLAERERGVKFEEAGDGTFVPLSGDERGVPHRFLTEEGLLLLFDRFSPLAVARRQQHICLTARRK